MNTDLDLSIRAAYVTDLEESYGINAYEWLQLSACNRVDTEHPAWAVLQYHSELETRSDNVSKGGF